MPSFPEGPAAREDAFFSLVQDKLSSLVPHLCFQVRSNRLPECSPTVSKTVECK